MTTVIAYQGRVATDRKLRIEPYSGETYFANGKSKIHKTEDGRGAFVFYYDLPTARNIPVIMQDFMDAIVNMHVNDTYPIISIKRETLLVIPVKMYMKILIKDTIYYFGSLDSYLEDNKVKQSKPGTLFKLYLAEIQPEDFMAGGTGGEYAIGLHLADPNLPLEEIMRRVPLFDNKSSAEFDIVDCKTLKPLIAPIKTRRKKNVSSK
jgi:hypothetical protein